MGVRRWKIAIGGITEKTHCVQYGSNTPGSSGRNPTMSGWCRWSGPSQRVIAKAIELAQR